MRGHPHSTARYGHAANVLGRTRTAEQRGGEPYTAHDDARGADRDMEEESAEIGAFLVFYVDSCLFYACGADGRVLPPPTSIVFFVSS